jgi:hypothetical protein
VIYDLRMSTLKEIEERQQRMYRLIDQMYAEEDMNKMLQVVQQLEKEAYDLQDVALAFQAKMEKQHGKAKVGRFEVVLTPEQRQIIMKETGIAMTTVWIDDQGGTRNQAMPVTNPQQILAEALIQAHAMKAEKPAIEAAKQKIASSIAEIEQGGPLYIEAVAKMKQDPRVAEILAVDKKKP